MIETDFWKYFNSYYIASRFFATKYVFRFAKNCPAAPRVLSLNPETIITQIFPEIQAIYKLRELVPMERVESKNPL